MASSPHTAQASASAAPGRPEELRDLLTWKAPVVMALSCVAVGQPLLDLYGRNPTVFLSANLSRPQIVAFALVVALAPGLVAVLVEVLTWIVVRRALRGVHTLIVAGFGFVFGLAVMRKVAPDASIAALVVAVALAVGIATAERRVAPVRTVLRYMAVLPVVVLVGFFFFSPASGLFGDEAEAVDLAAGSGTNATPAAADLPPVVFLLFDELPLVSLTASDGAIRDDLFPSFARVAATSTWYRNAAAQSPKTDLSVPSLLTGLAPRLDAVGSSVDWPRNLFTLLGGTYEVIAYEEATRLCPAAVCGETTRSPGSLSQVLTDSAVVFSHLTFPAMWRDDLPRIDDTWVGFIGDTEPDFTVAGAAEDQDRAAHEFLEEGGRLRGRQSGDPTARVGRLSAMTDRIDANAPLRLYFGHVMFPHQPWRITPEGRTVAEPAGLDDGRVHSGADSGRWVEDEAVTRFWRQRHLLQVGAADRLLGEIIARLEEEGLWDDALVVVVADHGITFDPGRYPRVFDNGASFDQMYRVPLFIKRPHQDAPEIVDETAGLVDVVPTLVDLLGLDVDWVFDGRSLISDPPPQTRSVVSRRGRADVPTGVESLFDEIRAKEAEFAPGTGWLTVAAAGPLGRYVGRDAVDVDDLARVDVVDLEVDQSDLLADLDLATDEVPVVVTGRLRLAEPTASREILLVLDGTVAGVAHLDGDGTDPRFVGLVAEELLVDGENVLDVIVPRR